MKRITILISALVIGFYIPLIFAEETSTNPMDVIKNKDRKALLSRIREINWAYDEGVRFFGSEEKAYQHVKAQDKKIRVILNKYHIEVPQNLTWEWLENLQQECAKEINGPAISLEKLTHDGQCSYCNLENMDLREVITSLNERGLSINLSHSLINNSNLSGTNLSTANLKNTKLKNSDLSNTNLTNANIAEAQLKNTNLNNTNLENADLSNATLKRIKLENANLENANLENTKLIWVNLSNANVENTNFENANLWDVNLFKAKFNEYTKLKKAQLFDISLDKVNLSNADLSNIVHPFVKTRNEKNF